MASQTSGRLLMPARIVERLGFMKLNETEKQLLNHVMRAEMGASELQGIH